MTGLCDAIDSSKLQMDQANFLAFGEMCNHCGGMVYHFGPSGGYINPRWIKRISMKKGKTMTVNLLTHVIWDFPVMLFNITREKIAKFVADRDNEDARWLNG
jgi:hypothetical protein